MLKFNRFIFVIGVPLALSLGSAGISHAQTLPATITVNGASTLTSFYPISIFGNNTAYWTGQTSNYAVSTLVQQAGNYFLRYPGGSSSDDYHWNSSGTFDTNNHWVPSGTTYTPGFDANMTYVGTTGSNNSPEFPYSYITDGNTTTRWLSNSDTNFPNHQWAYVDLTGASSTVNVSAVSIIWGTPYASTFVVQYWNSVAGATPYKTSPETDWANTSAATVTGTGGTQVVNFTSVPTRYIRILMTASSAGTGGAYSIAELYVFNGTTQVGANTASTAQNKVVVSSTDPASSKRYQTSPPGSMDFASFMTYVHSFTPTAIPILTVNFGTGTPSEAASWVNYANKTAHPGYPNGYGIKYWQVGNEMDGIWECGGPLRADDYAYRFTEYSAAMTAVDSTIILTGPVAGGPYDSSNAYDGNTFIQSFLLTLNNLGGIADLGALDYHWYPWNYGNTATNVEINTASQVASFAVSLSNWETSAGVNTNIPVIMSEYNISPATPALMNQLPTGLWLANWLGEFIRYFGSHGNTNFWDTLNGTAVTLNAGDQGYLQVAAGTYQYQPRANYWAMQMMATDWAIAADTNAHQLISTSVAPANGASTLLAAYSDYRPDSVFSLMVVNKDPANSYNTLINLPFSPNPTANSWTFSSANYVWTSSGAPATYYASPDTAPTTALMSGLSSSFPVTFAPYSINVIQFTNSGLPTNTATMTFTPTSTWTGTSTKTPTNTPTASSTGTSTSTPTSSPTATLTGTPSNTPTASSTGTPTNSPTASPTATLTGTPTLSPTTTFTGVPTDTQTMTPTLTSTDSMTATPSPSLTPSPTATTTATPTNTVCTDGLGNTCTYTPTSPFTPTPTSTFTNSFTWTVTITDTPTATSTYSWTPTPTVTFTSTATTTVTLSPTPTGTSTQTLSPTPTSISSLTGIYPNPVLDGSPVHVAYQVNQPASKVQLKIFTPAFRKIFEDDNLSMSAGERFYDLDWNRVGNISNGLYYVVLYVNSGGHTSRQVMKMLILR